MSENDEDNDYEALNAWAINEYLRNVTKYYAEETLNAYKVCPQLLFTSCKKSYKEVTKKDIKKWLSECISLKINKNSSICLRLAGVKSFFAVLHYLGFILINPASDVKYPKHDETLPKSLDNESSLSLKEAVIHNTRDRAIIELFLCSGLRVSEEANILLSEIKWEFHKILISKAKRNKRRFVFYSEICGQMLKEYIASRSDDCPYLFITRLSDKFTRQGLWFLVKKYVNIAGLDKRISVHWLRHTCAQNLSDKGMKDKHLAIILGHENTRYVTVYSQLKP